MRPIQMVDLQAQYSSIQTEAEAAMKEVIGSAAFIDGPQVEAFAQELASYMGTEAVIPCANGTDALQIAIMALDLPPQSEIIVPSFNYVAAAEVIALLGHKPVFAEVSPRTFNLDPDSAANCITDRTAAILVVHLFGQCADMGAFLELAKVHNLHLIEDNAQSIGARYTGFIDARAGTIGRVGTTSFFPSKNLGCMGDGGAILTQDRELAARMRKIAHHGQSRKYHYELIGVNSRLDTLQAALLSVKLKRLDDYTAARQEAAMFYDNVFAACEQVKAPLRAEYSTHVFHQYTLLVDPAIREGLQLFLKQNGIPSMVYYPVPLHLQEAFSYLGYQEGDLPVTELLSKSVLSLPMHTELTQEQLLYISDHVIRYARLHSRADVETNLVPE